jgi:hypothetical protein
MEEETIIIEFNAASIPPPVSTFPSGIELKNGPGSTFKLDGKKVFLLYPVTLDVNQLLLQLRYKWSNYPPKVWSRILLPDANNPMGWTVLLLLFDQRFRTQAVRYFDSFGIHPYICQIQESPVTAWDIAYRFVINYEGSGAKVAFPEIDKPLAYKDVKLTQPWQQLAHQWFVQGETRTDAGAPVLNLYHPSLPHSMNEFCQWMQYQYPQDTAVFSMDLSTEVALKKQLRNHSFQGWSGKYLIISLSLEKFKDNPKWKRSAALLQALRYGNMTLGLGPQAILIFSHQAITPTVSLDFTGISTTNLKGRSDLWSEDTPTKEMGISTANALFGPQTVDEKPIIEEDSVKSKSSKCSYAITGLTDLVDKGLINLDSLPQRKHKNEWPSFGYCPPAPTDEEIAKMHTGRYTTSQLD